MKIIGRTDDMVFLSHGKGLQASMVEPAINAHSVVKSALVGENGYSDPVLLVEFYPEAEIDEHRAKMIDSLMPYID